MSILISYESCSDNFGAERLQYHRVFNKKLKS